MFGFEKRRQQAIDLEQPLAGQIDAISMDLQQTVLDILLPDVVPLDQDIGAELPPGMTAFTPIFGC